MTPFFAEVVAPAVVVAAVVVALVVVAPVVLPVVVGQGFEPVVVPVVVVVVPVVVVVVPVVPVVVPDMVPVVVVVPYWSLTAVMGSFTAVVVPVVVPVVVGQSLAWSFASPVLPSAYARAGPPRTYIKNMSRKMSPIETHAARTTVLRLLTKIEASDLLHMNPTSYR